MLLWVLVLAAFHSFRYVVFSLFSSKLSLILVFVLFYLSIVKKEVLKFSGESILLGGQVLGGLM